MNQLCKFALKAYDFIDEHMYEFCMDNRMYSEDVYQSHPEAGELSADINLDKLGLCKGQKFILYFDFGDDWMFIIRVSSIIKSKKSMNPRLVKSKGFVQQYPDFDYDFYFE